MPIMAEKLTLLLPSARLGAAALFRAGGKVFSVDDAVASAALRGELDRWVGETLALVAAEELAERDDFTVTDDAAQAASERFRYAHELITAEETEAWLDSRDLTADDFDTWVYRLLCLEHYAPEEPAAIPDDFADQLRVHLWLSDGMRELDKQLRRRVAAGLAESELRPESGEPAVKRFLERHGFDDSAVTEWLSVLGRDRAWLERTARNETAFERRAAEAVNAGARARKLASIQLALVRVEVETLELESADAAREAILCVHDDRVTLAEVALDAGYHSDRAVLWAGEIDPALAQRLLGAGIGDLVGPIDRGGRFDVHQLLRKIEPSLEDPAIAERVDRALIDESFEELCSRHIE